MKSKYLIILRINSHACLYGLIPNVVIWKQMSRQGCIDINNQSLFNSFLRATRVPQYNRPGNDPEPCLRSDL